MPRHRLPAARPDTGTALLAPVIDAARHRAVELPVPRPPANAFTEAATVAEDGGPAETGRHSTWDHHRPAAAASGPRHAAGPEAEPAVLLSPPGRDVDAAPTPFAGRRATAGPPPRSRRAAAPRRAGSRRRGALVLVTVAACLLALPTVSSASADRCRWQRAAQALFLALDGRHDSRSDALRDALVDAGVGRDLPAECSRATGTPPTGSATSTAKPTTTHRTPQPTTTASAPTSASTPSSTAGTPAVTGGGSTAAAAFGWGTPTKSDDFTAGLSQWGVYNGRGHDGNGRRTPSAMKVADGILTITGDGAGNSGGMAWGDGRKFGRYEARVRSTAGDESYHPVMLLWPDAENWPVGGEIDWMEISSADRQDADTFLHFGADNDQVHGSVRVDATQWHNWAVEWSPHGVTTYLDGKPWWSTTNTRILPPGPMHMTIQLDYFGGGNPRTSQMQVDWVKQYAV